jgi:hypothetical protein
LTPNHCDKKRGFEGRPTSVLLGVELNRKDYGKYNARIRNTKTMQG